MLIVLLVVISVVFFSIRFVKNTPPPVRAFSGEYCSGHEGNACHYCTEGCYNCGNLICGRSTAACVVSPDCISGQGPTAMCVCHSSRCPCSNTAQCKERPTCVDTCPTPGDSCEPDSCDVKYGSAWANGTTTGFNSNCNKDSECWGDRIYCDKCHKTISCTRNEPSVQPAPTAHMLYCYSGYPDSCVVLSNSASNPTIVYPPRPAGGAFVGMAEVALPAQARGSMYYDMALDNVTTGAVLWGYNGWSNLRFDETTTVVSSGNTYHVKGRDASMPYCYDANLWCAGDSDPYNGEGPCTEVHGYFKISYPPTVTSVEVVANSKLKCTLPGGGISPWTGSFRATNPEVSNPIDIMVTVTDKDGWGDIDTVWLDIARQNMPTNYYCKHELVNYASIGLETSVLYTQGYQYAVSTQVLSNLCVNSGCNSAGSCSGICQIDLEGNLTFPADCACARNFLASPFASNPISQYDDPLCELRYVPGVPAECHSCMPMPDTPNYTVQNVTYSGSGITGTYTFTILFKDAYLGGAYPEGSQQFYVMAQSGLVFSGNLDGGYQPNRTTDPSWSWSFDFHEPGGSVSVVHDPVDSANVMRVTNLVTDNLSGARRVYDRKYWLVRDGAIVTPPIPDGAVAINPAETWFNHELSVSQMDLVTIPNLQGGDWVHSTDIREDIACNVNDNSDNSNQDAREVGPRWIITKLKDVYGWSGFDDPIQVTADGSSLSDFWTGGGNAAADFGSGAATASARGWYSPNYSDENRNAVRTVEWYNELYDLAMTSEWAETHGVGSISSIGELINVIQNGSSGVFVVTGVMTGSVSDPIDWNVVCSGRKIIFVPGTVNLEFEPDFTNADPQSACLFIVSHGTVSIQPGGDKPEPRSSCVSTSLPCVSADTLETAFITDGAFDVNVDASFPRPDRLEIFGFVFSDSANFGRDMLWEDNWVKPTGKITYDPKYYALFNDMLGRKPYSEMECGIVKDSPACLNWVENP